MAINNKSGFTLIELMVVIIIIAILSTLGIVYYGNFLKNSRDAKRQSDLKFIQSALEDYHADHLSYPPSLDDLQSGSRVYMKQIPADPKGANYSYTVSGTEYCLSTLLESVDLADECTPASGNNYGVNRP